MENVTKPFVVVSGKYRFRFLPEDIGFSVTCTNLRGVATQGDSFEEALANAHDAARLVEECLADIAKEKIASSSRVAKHPKKQAGKRSRATVEA